MSEMMTLLGIDLGTSSVKTLLMRENGTVSGSCQVEYPVLHLNPLWSEQKPDVWWQATKKSCLALRANHPADYGQISAIGLSGQMHAAVLLGKDSRPLRPAILWNDGRSFAECTELNSRMPDLGTVAGVSAMPGFTAPKLLWIAKHEKEIFAKITKILLAKDYIRLKLAGGCTTDISDAAGTLWLDQQKRNWSDQLLDLCGLSLNQMPGLVEGNVPTGNLRASVAQGLGLSPKVIVAGGGGDAAAGAVGVGCVEEGDAFISLGSSGQYFVCGRDYRPNPEQVVHAFAHAVPDRWYQMGCILNGASTLSWFARNAGGASIESLIKSAGERYDPDNKELFLPYLDGERTPHNNPFAQAAFLNITASTEREQLTQAVMEGVAFCLADCQDALKASGTETVILGAVGGGARSKLWLQICATILGKPINCYQSGFQGAALGAARLALMALANEPVSKIAFKPKVIKTIYPDPLLAEIYYKKHQAFKRAYRIIYGQTEVF